MHFHVTGLLGIHGITNQSQMSQATQKSLEDYAVWQLSTQLRHSSHMCKQQTDDMPTQGTSEASGEVSNPCWKGEIYAQVLLEAMGIYILYLSSEV